MQLLRLEALRNNRVRLTRNTTRRGQYTLATTMKFSTKLFFLYVGMIIGIFAPICYLLHDASHQLIEKQVKDRLSERTFHIMDKLDRVLFERFADIQVLASDAVLQNPHHTPQELTERLLTYRNTYQIYLSIAFFDATRRKIADTINLSLGQFADHSLWVKQVFEEGKISAASDVHFVEELQRMIIFFAMPVYSPSKEMIGAVVFYLPMEETIHLLLREFKQTGQREDIHLDLVDEEGNLLYSNYM